MDCKHIFIHIKALIKIAIIFLLFIYIYILHICLPIVRHKSQVFVHNPNSRSLNADGRWVMSASVSDINYLNINQTVNALAAGKLRQSRPTSTVGGNQKSANNKSRTSSANSSTGSTSGGGVGGTNSGGDNDVLVIGTPTSIMVYDVITNSDLFYKEVPDGANAVIIGEVGTIHKPLAIVGGNCALQGFDYEGTDSYWTVTGDNITCMVLTDLDEDGQNELLVGSDDHDIRVFKEDAITYELSETDTITSLCAISPHTFAYALANGTVGVYHKKERLWRIKSKNQAICLLSFDVNQDGKPELVTGWSNGKLDARNIENGEVLFRDNLSHSIAGLLVADYNLDGIDELIVCTVEGEIRGYVSASPQERQSVMDANFEQDTVREMMKKRQNLLMELRNYEENSRIQRIADPFISKAKATMENDQFGAIPANTQLRSALVISQTDKLPCVELTLETTNDTIIRTVVIFAEGIFKGESQVIHPVDSQVRSEISVALRPPKDLAIDLHVKALVGYKSSFHYHVFELTRHLPRFSMYAVTKLTAKPQSHVSFVLPEKLVRVTTWLNANFLLVEEFDYGETLDISFVSLRDGSPLALEMDGRTGELTVRTDNIELAGDIVQSLVYEYLGIEDMSSTASFPVEVDKLKKFVNQVEELQNVRQRLAAEIADNSVAIRELVVRAEDARLIGEIKLMKNLYNDLNTFNTDLITEYKIRCQNHQDLVDSLKQVNVCIQRAGNLRVGKPKSQLINSCRNAIQQNNLNLLSRIISDDEF
ncbi:Bardet-Biedl syndrome 2 protein homolog [Oppia nitens]|uniref:Bardet-Biedl syndrome 2 protein homolog n=1 Tax=Oppia nitens TaxID=1686743 RepID=UPI0023DC1C63|nr:Bardet-Biedl syndrome 2 protein homolog [Oppia nitens]